MSWFVILLIAAPIGCWIYLKWASPWREEAPHPTALQFLNTRMAVRLTVLGHTVPDGYRLACLYFGARLIDRTGTLDHGFPYKVIDPIPDIGPTAHDLSSVCDQRASEVVAWARSQERPIRLAWSGGIDSTAACIALLKALGPEAERLEIVYSQRSIKEYPAFYETFIEGRLREKNIERIGEALDPATLFVTGEHGDRRYGSPGTVWQPGGGLRRPYGA